MPVMGGPGLILHFIIGYLRGVFSKIFQKKEKKIIYTIRKKITSQKKRISKNQKGKI